MLRKLIAILAFSLLVCSTAYCFDLLDTNAVTSLEIKYKYEDTDIIGAEFKLYKVAEVSSDVRYTATEQFAKYSVSFDMREDGGRALAQTLAAYANRDDIIPVGTDTTDADGRVKFSGLKTGLYLANSPTYRFGGYDYMPEPFLVCLPDYEDNKWINDVSASPKVSREKVPTSGGGGGTPSVTPKTDIGVLKVWEEDNEEERPESVEVELLRNGIVYHRAVLNKDNNWHYTWNDLPDYGTYEVTEKNVPESYKVSVTREGDVFVVKNTGPGTPEEPSTEAPTEAVTEPKPEPATSPSPAEVIIPPNPPVIQEPVIPDNDTEESTEDPYGAASGRGGRSGAYTTREGEEDNPNVPGVPGSGSAGGTGSRAGSSANGRLPQTGQLWWPVPIMSTFGLILFLLGFIRHKEQERKLSQN